MIIVSPPPVLDDDLTVTVLAAPAGLEATGRVHVAVRLVLGLGPDGDGDGIGYRHADWDQRLTLDIHLALAAIVAVVARPPAVAVAVAVAAVRGLGALGLVRLFAARLMRRLQVDSDDLDLVTLRRRRAARRRRRWWQRLGLVHTWRWRRGGPGRGHYPSGGGGGGGGRGNHDRWRRWWWGRRNHDRRRLWLRQAAGWWRRWRRRRRCRDNSGDPLFVGLAAVEGGFEVKHLLGLVVLLPPGRFSGIHGQKDDAD